MINPNQEKKVGHWIIAGIVLMVFGLFCFVVGTVAGVNAAYSPFGSDKRILANVGAFLLIFIAGFFSLGYGLFQMYWVQRKADTSMQVSSLRDVYVIGKFAYDKERGTVFPTEPEFEFPLTYYVKLENEAGQQFELKTSPEVYFSFGEGMKGNALVQGNWLSSFQPGNQPVKHTSQY